MNFTSKLKANQLVLLLLVGSFLRLYHIDFQSVWLDEIHTINESNPSFSWSQIYGSLLASDPHPPLYFVLVQLCFKLFGYSTIVVRLFSAIAGIAGIWAIYLLGKEIVNKQTGLIAATLLTFSYFHIYYSQEARMYSLLFLTTTLSFYFLARLIKQPTLKHALLHGLMAALMIYTHFFALFALFAQYLILLFFILKPFSTSSKTAFRYGLISGVLTLVLFVPCFNIFLQTTKKTSMWIPSPTVDVYTQIFKEFFGQSELVLFLVCSVMLLFFIKLYSRPNFKSGQVVPETEPQVFAFLFFFTWIAVTLMIPLISSYVKLPMIVSRYFINILPAVLIMVAMGIYYIKNDVVKGLVLSFLIVFSFTDVVIVKGYYKNVTKTQFREATDFIKSNNSGKDPVVTSLGWYLPYFLDNGTEKTTIVDKPLQDYVNEMIQDSAKLKSFWYIDGHIRPYALNEAGEAFLNQHFIIDHKVDLYDAWSKHYLLKSDAKFKNADLKKFEPIGKVNGDPFAFAIGTFEGNENGVDLSGFAFFEGQDATATDVDVVLIGNGKAILFWTSTVRREDVAPYFHSNYDLSHSGFSAQLPSEAIPSGEYVIGLWLRDTKTGKEGLTLTDKTFKK
ncbi:MAG: hypothetical protein EOO51_10665 [Flavobacterium sp.]|nr:MAG: hypothetical protein EOO51_10665 [Flavobacterium sp.]